MRTSDTHNNIFLLRVMSSALYVSVFAASWDIWWHTFLGRETFWSPPHLLLYGSISIVILAAFYGWYLNRSRIWKILSFALFLVPLSAPFDELWHRTFGIELPSSVLVLWSPPHLVLILATVIALFIVLSQLGKSGDTARNFFGILVLAALYQLLFILTNPFEPTGAWHLIGFLGAGVTTFVLIFVLLLARNWLSGVGRTVLVSFPIITLVSTGFSGALIENSPVLAHAHAPGWLIILSILLPAILLDNVKLSNVVSGVSAGVISGTVLYGTAPYFIDPIFKYGSIEVGIAIIASIVGGFLAGVLVKFTLNSRFSFAENK